MMVNLSLCQHLQHDKSQGVIVLLNPVLMHKKSSITYVHLKYKGDGMSITMKLVEIFNAYLL